MFFKKALLLSFLTFAVVSNQVWASDFFDVSAFYSSQPSENSTSTADQKKDKLSFVYETFEKVNAFYEDYKKPVWIAAGAVGVSILAYLGYRYWTQDILIEQKIINTCMQETPAMKTWFFKPSDEARKDFTTCLLEKENPQAYVLAIEQGKLLPLESYQHAMHDKNAALFIEALSASSLPKIPRAVYAAVKANKADVLDILLKNGFFDEPTPLTKSLCLDINANWNFDQNLVDKVMESSACKRMNEISLAPAHCSGFVGFFKKVLTWWNGSGECSFYDETWQRI